MIPDFDPAAVPAEQIPAALARIAAEQSELAARQTALTARLLAPSTAPAAAETDKMLTVDELAERLRCSTKSIYRRAKSFPFARRNGSRGWIFSEQGLTKWLARQRV